MFLSFSGSNIGTRHLELNEQVARLECLSFRNSSPSEPNSPTLDKDICPFCVDCFDLDTERDSFLTHLLKIHKLVVADVEEIADFRRCVLIYFLLYITLHFLKKHLS